MRHAIGIFMLVEAASFVAAALIHSGLLVTGYEHARARVAESVITVVLVSGLALTWSESVRRCHEGQARFETGVGPACRHEGTLRLHH